MIAVCAFLLKYSKCIFVFSPFERILQAVNSFASFINTLRDMVAEGPDSNRESPAYEAGELPFLYPAIFNKWAVISHTQGSLSGKEMKIGVNLCGGGVNILSQQFATHFENFTLTIQH